MNGKYIYLHGFASGPASGKARFFSRRFAALGLPLEVPDMAEGNFRELTLGGQLRLVERLAGAGPVVLIGSSMGGYVAALHAARSPVDRLVLLAPAFRFARRWSETLGPERMARWKRDGEMKVFHYAANAEREIGYGLIEDALERDDFPRVSQPALVFHGVRDDVVPVEYSRRFASARNVTLHEVDSGHELLDVLDFMWRETALFLGFQDR